MRTRLIKIASTTSRLFNSISIQLRRGSLGYYRSKKSYSFYITYRIRKEYIILTIGLVEFSRSYYYYSTSSFATLELIN